MEGRRLGVAMGVLIGGRSGESANSRTPLLGYPSFSSSIQLFEEVGDMELIGERSIAAGMSSMYGEEKWMGEEVPMSNGSSSG